MSINIELLSRLVRWAAEDHARGTDPERAVALGLAKEGDPRLGRWNQGSWGFAERNGVCQTAFCIAGGAAALDDSVLVVMEAIGSTGEVREYSSSYVVSKDLIPEGADTKWGYWWLKPGEDVTDLVNDDDLKYIAIYAQAALGLNIHQRRDLFNGSNSIEDVVSLANEYAVSEGKNLDVPVWVLEAYNTY